MQIQVKKNSGLLPYREAYSYMLKYQEAVIEGKKPSLLWFLEHDDVITAGRGAKYESLNDIEYTDRGGKLTYHGPGQRIIYMVLDLKQLFYPKPPDIKLFVRKTMEWLKFSLEQIGVNSKIDQEGIGLWCNYGGVEYKIVSLGLKVKKWVTAHGVAINIAPDLAKFNAISPCGLDPKVMGSVARYLGKDDLPVDFIDQAFIKGFEEFFDGQIIL